MDNIIPKIVVKQTVIEINNYDLGDCPRIEKYYSVWDPTYHTYFQVCIEYIEEEKKLLLPRGMNIGFLEHLFNETAYIDHLYDTYDTFTTPGIKYLPRDDRQKEALMFMIGADKYKWTSRHSQLSVNLNTGHGKTYCSIATICYTGIRSIIIGFSIELLKQWINMILEYTDIQQDEIYFIEGSASIQRLLKRSKEEMSKFKIFLSSHNTLKSYGKTNGWKAITKLFKYLKIGIKFYDEAHLNLDNMCSIDFYTNTYKTYYVTATLERSHKQENIIFQHYFKNIPKIDLFNETEDPRTHYLAILFKSHPTAYQIEKCKNQYGLDRSKYIEYLSTNKYFECILHILMQKIFRVRGKVLIYIGINSVILKIKEWIEYNYPELIGSIGVYTSITSEDIKHLEKEKKIILSTIKSCGVAMDISNLSLTIVLAEPFKSAVLARQTLGRTREYNTEYWEIVDTSFLQTKRFYTEKKPTFEKYALSCKEIRIDDIELHQRATTIINSRSNLVPLIEIL